MLLFFYLKQQTIKRNLTPISWWTLQRWPDAKAQFEGVLANCGGPGQPHALHVHSIDCRTPLLNCCNGVGDTKGAAAQLAQMIAAMRTLLGGLHKDLQACFAMCTRSCTM